MFFINMYKNIMKKVSIIMPLYNAERYLRECLDSIIRQVFHDFELICINDCSSDETLNILNIYRKLDKRIKVFSNMQHQGAAYSRNRGLKEARGEYLLFLDGDDIFDEELLSLTFNKAVESQADVVVYPSVCVTTDVIHQQVSNEFGREFVKKYCTHTFAINELMACEYLLYQSTLGDKIFRREFILNEGLEFQDLSCCNDVYFVNMALLLSQKIIWLNTNKKLVYVRVHNTPSRISSNRDPMCAYYADKRILDELSRRGKLSLLYRYCYLKFYLHFCMVLSITDDLDKMKQFYEFLSNEGITTMKEIGDIYYNNLDKYIKEGYNKFLNKNSDIMWFREVNVMQLYLYDNLLIVRKLFKEWNDENKKVGLWGIESNALVFLKFCNEQGLYIDALMDRDEEKQGKTILNFPSITPTN